MLGEASHLELRRKLSAGEATGPRLITSGPSLNGRSVVSPEQAAAMVREQAAAGYDFLKLHPGLTRGEYEAIVEAAKDVGIPFAGHVSVEVGIPLTLASRQATIDHLDGYAQELVPGDHPLHGVAPEFFGVNLAAGLRTARVRDLARATRDAGVWNVPTQSLLENMLYAQSLDALMARPEMSYVQASTIEQWRERVVAIRESIGPSLAQNFLSTRRALLEQLQIEGAGLLLGSDAPQIMNVPGFSIHEELGYLVGAGLTPYQALATGTIHIATFLGEPDRGRVEPGFVADLVLLAGNPLEDVSRTREVLGVMRGGEWYERRWLDERLEAIRRRKI
jgi:hypothetical protein